MVFFVQLVLDDLYESVRRFKDSGDSNRFARVLIDVNRKEQRPEALDKVNVHAAEEFAKVILAEEVKVLSNEVVPFCCSAILAAIVTCDELIKEFSYQAGAYDVVALVANALAEDYIEKGLKVVL